jgi:hypothetical protein
MRLLATMAAGLAACTYSADFNGARFACDSLTPCPDGVACIDGYCQAPSLDAAGDQPDATGDLPDAGGDRLRWVSSAIGSVDSATFSAVESDMIAAQPGDLYVVFVSIKPARDIISVSGLGLSWTKAREQCTGRSTARFAMFWALDTAGVSGKVTAVFPASATPSSAVVSVHRYAGADADTPVGDRSGANSNGHDGDASCSDGVDTATYSWSSLDTAGTNSIVVSGVHTANYPGHAAGDGFTERSDDQSGSTSISAGVAVEERRVAEPTSNLTVSGGWENAPDWAAIAAELRD